MRIAKFLVMMLIASGSVSMISCSKSSGKPSNSAIEGKWVGKYGFDDDAPSVFYSFFFKAGGVLEEYGESGLKIAVGTWKLENNIIMGKTTSLLGSGNEYSIIAAFDASKGKLDGNWGYDDSNTDGGTWFMTRQ